MPAQPRPIVRRRRLGSVLRRLRERAGVKMDEAAARIDGDKPKISRIENGRLNVRRLEVEALAELYGVTDERAVAALVTLARESRKTSWWHQYGQNLNEDFEEQLDLEQDAQRIYAYQPLLIPGLLQTPAYAETIIRSENPATSEEQIKTYLAMRVTRQRIFQRESPPQYVCVLDESVLHRQVGGASVLGAQLARLLEINNPPQLTIQVVPFDQGWHAGLHGAFRRYSYADPLELDVVAVDYLDGVLYLEDDPTVEKYRMAFDQLRASALSSTQSMDRISRLARDLNG